LDRDARAGGIGGPATGAVKPYHQTCRLVYAEQACVTPRLVPAVSWRGSQFTPRLRVARDL